MTFLMSINVLLRRRHRKQFFSYKSIMYNRKVQLFPIEIKTVDKALLVLKQCCFQHSIE